MLNAETQVLERRRHGGATTITTQPRARTWSSIRARSPGQPLGRLVRAVDEALDPARHGRRRWGRFRLVVGLRRGLVGRRRRGPCVVGSCHAPDDSAPGERPGGRGTTPGSITGPSAADLLRERFRRWRPRLCGPDARRLDLPPGALADRWIEGDFARPTPASASSSSSTGRRVRRIDGRRSPYGTFGRRVVLPLAFSLIAVGLAGWGSRPRGACSSSPGFRSGSAGARSTAAPTASSSISIHEPWRALNLLHLFLAWSAASPLVVGASSRQVSRGRRSCSAWRSPPSRWRSCWP